MSPQNPEDHKQLKHPASPQKTRSPPSLELQCLGSCARCEGEGEGEGEEEAELAGLLPWRLAHVKPPNLGQGIRCKRGDIGMRAHRALEFFSD